MPLAHAVRQLGREGGRELEDFVAHEGEEGGAAERLLAVLNTLGADDSGNGRDNPHIADKILRGAEARFRCGEACLGGVGGLLRGAQVTLRNRTGLEQHGILLGGPLLRLKITLRRETVRLGRGERRFLFGRFELRQQLPRFHGLAFADEHGLENSIAAGADGDRFDRAEITGDRQTGFDAAASDFVHIGRRENHRGGAFATTPTPPSARFTFSAAATGSTPLLGVGACVSFFAVSLRRLRTRERRRDQQP